MTDQQIQTRPVQPAAHHDDAQARIDSWWLLPTAEEADAAARRALEVMPRTDGLLRFSVLRAPAEPALFLQSLWTTAAARDHYVHQVAAAPRAAVDERAPGIQRDRALTEIVAVVAHSELVAEKWVTRRIPVVEDARAQVDREIARLRGHDAPGLVRASIGLARDEHGEPVEVVVIEERNGPTGDVLGYEPVGAVASARETLTSVTPAM
ncbi:hypothetical protein SAMN05421805_11853 [Saccharopolyspora antimicrobica]|uniref:Antibiotic biosynthesis monooxygenase n=1 Tax=Saccharopolyspora antimicrobica TaxID=455193 RepID=A0A1I5IDG2_9PSEU|nr:hypothetical protein [Saccharopolyspora antimicrobica]RKT85545.1 hypothetical protein ATL45_3892 [Saccharopolyspora antimicrobica]SFO58081.1 hypothetical protein SAMN05421805_11853 [Saccharopolyspora antimicrobica]